MIIYIILILAVLILGFVLLMKHENKALTVTDYTVCSDRLPKEAIGRNFVVIADLHNNQFGFKNARLIQKIDEIAPDFIIIAGDLFVAKDYEFDLAYEFLEQICKKYPVYYSYGNHEQKVEQYENNLAEGWTVRNDKNSSKKIDTRRIKTFAEYVSLVKKLGVHILDNETVKVPVGNGKHLNIIGGTIGLEYFNRLKRPVMTCDYLKQCFGQGECDCYQILIAHNPMYFDTYAQWGADLVLSGHVHGGMVRVPILGGAISPQMEIFPKYDAGRYETEHAGRKSVMILSRGLGIHTLKVRIFNRPELVSVTLERK